MEAALQQVGQAEEELTLKSQQVEELEQELVLQIQQVGDREEEVLAFQQQVEELLQQVDVWQGERTAAAIKRTEGGLYTRRLEVQVQELEETIRINQEAHTHSVRSLKKLVARQEEQAGKSDSLYSVRIQSLQQVSAEAREEKGRYMEEKGRMAGRLMAGTAEIESLREQLEEMRLEKGKGQRLESIERERERGRERREQKVGLEEEEEGERDSPCWELARAPLKVCEEEEGTAKVELRVMLASTGNYYS